MITEFLHEYFHIVTDLSHVSAELTFLGVEALIARPIFKLWLKKHDQKVHGIK